MVFKRLSILLVIFLGLTLGCLWALGGDHVGAAPSPLTEIRVCPSGCAHVSIQAAVDAASDGDVIKVAEGTYTDVHVRSGITQVVYISKTVTLRGGYTSSEWTMHDPTAHPTTLDAQGQGRVMVITGTSTATIEGLHITGGDATGLGALIWGGDAGGGVYVVGATPVLSHNVIYSNTSSTAGGDLDNGGGVCTLNSDAKFYANTIYSNTAGQFGGGMFLVYGAPLLSQNIITGNIADYYGGGLFLDWSSATLNDNVIAGNEGRQRGGGLYLASGAPTLGGNTISDNEAWDGGGLYLEGGNAQLSGNTITANRTNYGGGGLFLVYATPLMNGDVISGNIAHRGGGLYIWESSPTLTNTVVSDNEITGATGKGAGLYLEKSLGVRMLHTTIARNTGGDGSGVCVTDDGWGPTYRSAVTMTNTILTGHTVGITASTGCTATLNATLWHANGDDWDGAGTVNHLNDHNGDPAFAADGYHLTPGSAAIDEGVNAGVTTDLDGESRPADAGYDLGADEFIFVPPTAVILNAPSQVLVGTTTSFTATVAPPTTTTPLTYTWEASGHAPVIDTAGLTHTYAFSWTTKGTKTVTVTVENAGSTTAIDEILTIKIVPYRIYLPLVTR